LGNITIPIFVPSIGQSTFDGCASLATVTIPSSVTNIDVGAFQSCTGLTNIILPNGIISIGNGAFYNCSRLPGVSVPASVGSIAQGAFASCASLTDISVAAANPAYSSKSGILFDKAYDSLIQYPAGLPNSVYAIPNSVNAIGGNAFSACENLRAVTIPNSVTNIGSFAFYQSTNLASVTLPASVTSISDSAFASCTSLKSAYFAGDAPPDLGDAFSGDPVAIVYYLPGTTEWGATFGDAPTELWNPQATAFAISGAQFSFNITGPANATVVVEACTSLADPVWLPMSTNTLSGSGASSFTDLQGTDFSNHYYRFSAP
jgi:hypothetical protein